MDCSEGAGGPRGSPGQARAAWRAKSEPGARETGERPREAPLCWREQRGSAGGPSGVPRPRRGSPGQARAAWRAESEPGPRQSQREKTVASLLFPAGLHKAAPLRRGSAGGPRPSEAVVRGRGAPVRRPGLSGGRDSVQKRPPLLARAAEGSAGGPRPPPSRPWRTGRWSADCPYHQVPQNDAISPGPTECHIPRSVRVSYPQVQEKHTEIFSKCEKLYPQVSCHFAISPGPLPEHRGALEVPRPADGGPSADSRSGTQCLELLKLYHQVPGSLLELSTGRGPHWPP